MRTRILLLTFVLLSAFVLNAQDRPVHPSKIVTGKFIGISKPLRDLPKMSIQEFNQLAEKAKTKQFNESLRLRYYPFASTALPKGPDPVWQQTPGMAAGSRAPIANFNGQASPYYPPDCNGAVGPSHYMQDINSVYAIYNKSGTLVAGPTSMNLLFGSVTGATYNDGDPVILYDEMAGRWVATEFSISGSNDYEMIAISTTSDPTGTWYQYSFDVADMPDYPKFGVWPDGYYMADNNSSGNDIYVFQRSAMLTGATASMQGFDNPYRPTSVDGFMMVPPVDNDGTTPAPNGAPGTFIAFNDDALGGGSDQLWIYELSVNWTTPASSTFARVQQLAVASFSADFGSTWNNIAQSGTTQKVDAIPQVIMNVPQYRNFGSYQTIVCCHTVDVDGTDHAGVRWYELRRAGQTSGNWAVRQQGTYAPDANQRWMGSIMLNGTGKIGLGYSVSSSTMFPSIRYTGQSASAYAAGNSTLDLPEETIQTGSYSQSSYNRWGDYSDLSIDPTDDNTFWFTTEYIGSGGTRQTKIASFKFGNNPTVVTLDASSVTGTAATLNGTINPNGLATTYYFQWGTTASYGSTTTSTSAGSGSATVPVSASLTGLTSGTTYHFRLVGTNSDGPTNGNDMTFTPGAATVITSAASLITMTSATVGGTVSSDGGTSVTARGVCWSTTSGPTIAGSHTSTGTGTGTFSSSLTGLSANTTYYIRAYATNSGGTWYGSELNFTTLCGIYTPPFSEAFPGTTIPTCWSQIDHQGNGQIWTFGTITTASPNPTLTGNYAYLNSDAYGSGNSQNADLITPTLNLSAYSPVTLQFNHYFKSYSGSSGTLSYSIDNGTTWTTISTFTTTTSSNPTAFTQAIPGAALQSAVKFKWNYTGTWGYYWAIDDIQVTGTLVTASLTVTPSVQNVTAAPGTTPFAVTTTSAWTATSNQAWCTVTPSGTGTGTLTATYTQNTTAAARSATVTVTVIGVTPVTVTVTQAAPTLAVTPSDQPVTPAAGTTPFTVTSNSYWTATSNQGWCTVTPSGTGSGTITATYTQNTTASSRVATVTTTVAGLTPVTTTVTQAAPTLSVTPSTQSVTAIAGTTPFTVTSNSAWTCTSDQSWCVPTASGTGTGTITATYTANSLFTSRLATLTVTVTGLTPVTVTVNQAGVLPSLSVTPSDQPVAPASGNTSFTVTSNTTWTASSNQTWCTVTPSGSGSGTISANYTTNNTTLQRVASITVTVTGLTPVVVTVTQAAPALSVTPATQPVTYPTGNTSFAVTSNTNWSASSNQSWCTVTSSGSGNGSITATYTANSTYVSRVANITVSVTGLSPIIVTVAQDAAPLPEFNYVILNDVQTSDRTLEFDLYLLDTQPASTLELSLIQAGILVNNGIISGGTITTSIVPGYSDLVTAQQPATAIWATGASNGCIKITPNASPACGMGSVIGTTGYGTRICRVRITNSVPFTGSSRANLAFSFTTSPYPTKVYQFAGSPCLSTQMTTNTVNCFSLASNPLLNGPATLSVSPSDQPVPASAGTVPFTVTSNASWTVSSNQSWCSVTPSGYGNGTIIANFSENTDASPRVANVTVTVTGLTPVVVSVTQNGAPLKTLHLSVFLEGLYTGNNTMHAAMDEEGEHWGPTTADKVTVELHSAADYSVVVYTASNIILNTDGTLSFTLPSSYAGSYYLTLIQRNHILTTTASPVSFTGATVSYLFDSPAKAYGDNLELMIDGHYVFYAGDVNQDGIIDASDLSGVYNLATQAASGYLPEDVNGDGLIDASDLSMTFNNANNAVGSVTP